MESCTYCIFCLMCNFILKEKKQKNFCINLFSGNVKVFITTTCIKNVKNMILAILWSCPAGIYLLKVNNRNTRTRCEICSKLTIKTPERRQWRRSGVSIFDFEHVISGWQRLSGNINQLSLQLYTFFRLCIFIVGF